jgi:uncharacterized membrane protein YraQ (UPF0718 family)
MKFFYILTILSLLISFYYDRKKTISALKLAGNRFFKMVPAFFLMVIFVSIFFYFVSDNVIFNFLSNENKFFSVIIASILGSITLMPGMIAFPVCGILLKKGVSYMVLSAFTTTMMSVGILTYPVEKAYFGARVTIIRNIVNFFIAIIVALITGIFYGEIF